MVLRVLIVDDDSLIRESLAAYLEDEGMEVVGVSSGEEAVRVIRDGGPIDACVIDMRLPDMDGNDAIRALHGISSRLDFLVHTGSLAYSLPRDLRDMGLSEERIFLKPLDDMAPVARALKVLKTWEPSETG